MELNKNFNLLIITIMEISQVNVKAIRKLHGLTQIEMGKMLAVRNTTISAYETGSIVPNDRTLNKLSRLYDIPISDLKTKVVGKDIILTKDNIKKADDRKDAINAYMSAVYSGTEERGLHHVLSDLEEVTVRLIEYHSQTKSIENLLKEYVGLESQNDTDFEFFKFSVISKKKPTITNASTDFKKQIDFYTKFILELTESM